MSDQKHKSLETMVERYVDPEYYQSVLFFVGMHARCPKPTLPRFKAQTANIHVILGGSSSCPDNVEQRRFTVKSDDDANILVTRFASLKTLGSTKPTAAVIYIHGGGFVALSIEVYASEIGSLARDSDMAFFGVDYRLAPEHRGPRASHDCYAVLQHISERASEFNIDAARIALMGNSAGATISAGTSLLARDRALSPPLAKQILIYLLLDDCYLEPNLPESPEALDRTCIAMTRVCLDGYLGEGKWGRPDSPTSPYAIPARASTLRGLPATYLEAPGLDLYRHDALSFVSRLLQDDVSVEFHLWPGLPHEFDLNKATSWYKRAFGSRLRAIKSIGI
ncbi:hypothetical protein HIM_03776 [Hirsutella minnesotensis 3608]|uniref:Alpha/beta hydrolase fold-3 domain-containing protein n=1 Tax=Hirsutella minnesotensis 3608 TaxID=1043627 RepID=A0A0F8A6D7_9HYPO|nr:hypothetical protein HIM_03776 [Hirsutella minnesotensis 3608]